MTEALALVLLAATLVAAVTRPGGLPEVAVAAPAAAIAILAGAISLSDALDLLNDLAPTIVFLAAVLVLGDLCEREGLFAAAGRWMGLRARGRPTGLLRLVVLVAAATTAVLSLDATVVLLTPAVFAAAAAQRMRARPHVYACVHLANSASLLLPVANLTNLLAFDAAGVSFSRFAALMLLPWIAAVGVDWAGLRRAFASDLAAPPAAPTAAAPAAPPGRPGLAIAVVGLTLAGFVAGSIVGVAPAGIAVAGAAVLAVVALRDRVARPADVVRATAPGFLLFVVGLAVVVRAAADGGLGDVVTSLVPGGTTLPVLLAIAGIAAVLANLVTNLPAILILLPALAVGGPGPVLAGLIGVNVGPNLTYVGSLATLLWRRTLRRHDAEADAGLFLRLGLLTVPLTLVIATGLLWVSLQVLE